MLTATHHVVATVLFTVQVRKNNNYKYYEYVGIQKSDSFNTSVITKLVMPRLHSIFDV